MTHYGDALPVASIFLGKKVSAKRGMNTKPLENLRRHGISPHMLRLRSCGEVVTGVGVTGHVFKKLAKLSQVLQLLPSQIHLIGLCLVGLSELDDAVGFRKGQRAEQYPIYNCKDGRVRADTERQSQNRDDSESRALRQHSRRESYVLPECFHEPPRRHAPTRASCVSSTMRPSNK